MSIRQVLLAVATVAVALLALDARAAGTCEVCVTVLKGIGDLGTTADNCTLLAELANQHFGSDSEGGPAIPQATNFLCQPNFTPTEIYACEVVDPPTADMMMHKFDYDTDSVYFYYFIPFDINEINTCLYPINHPYNRKGVALTSECFQDGPVVKLPPITSCERPPRPERSPRPPSTEASPPEDAPPPGGEPPPDNPPPPSPSPPPPPSPLPRPVHCRGDKERITIRLHRWLVGHRRNKNR
ncbi:hypothetical protein HXX76_011456 [Chlamydomonas incerta]|uniref:Uncharacterized protein n=1 Tax=Chlamydomonas incerta TaxID=51695 RepID=A0A835SKM8_CHLIN|nr:hypothetical protein HXX76_011456 [Chlamydomonas incerta]|eukprot:KAG2428754.1 hypothetical protein HXX76_011456 [Chlamydomonas incerta]